MYYIGADMGGTNIAVGTVDERGKLLSKVSLKTDRGAEKITEQIEELCRRAAEESGTDFSDIEAVGIGVPGSVSPETGVVDFCCNLDFHELPLGVMLEERLNKRVVLENDANAAALAEYEVGAGCGCESLVMVTLGTGIGGGIIINGRVYGGFNGASGELGHMVIKSGGEECTCGRSGCFERYASATALIRETKKAMSVAPQSLMWKIAGNLDKVGGRTAFIAAGMGDKTAQGVITCYIEDLACGITNIVNILQPELILFGGGVSGEGEALIDPVREILERQVFTRAGKKKTRLAIAELKNDAGIIGAALSAKNAVR
jgi:Transcriptional regulator/sugar kinase